MSKSMNKNKAYSEKELALGILRDPKLLRHVANSSLTSEDFQKPSVGWLVDKAKDYYNNASFGRRPLTPDIVWSLLKDDKKIKKEERRKYKKILQGVFSKRSENPQYAVRRLEALIKRREFINILESGADGIQEGEDIDFLLDEMAKRSFELRITKQKQRIQQTDFIKDFDSRQKERKYIKEHPEEHKKLNIGIKSLDELVPNGIGSGEMLSIAALTGLGKSIMLTQIGSTGLFQGFNVTHVITENSLEQITTRYDSKLSGIKYDDFRSYELTGYNEILLKQLEKVYDLFDGHYDNKLKIIKMPVGSTTTLDIYEIVEELEFNGHKTDVLLVDSPELMAPVAKYKEYRLQRAAVYYELLALLDEKEIRGVVSTQLSKASKGTLGSSEDLSEAYEKARLIAYLIILSQNKKQKLMGDIAAILAKSRDSASNSKVALLRPDLARMCMDTTAQELLI